MLQFARWKVALILLVVIAGIVVVIPNFFSRATVDSLPSWLPNQQVVLGLDLQGGAYLLYEVDQKDYVEKRLRTLVSDVRKAMLETPRIGYTGLGVQGNGVQLRIRDLSQLDEARTRLEKLQNPLSTSLLGGGAVNEFDLSVSADGLARFTYSEQGLAQRVRQHRPAVDRGHQPAHQRARHDRAEHPAPGRRPHPRRGARSRRPAAPQGDRRPDGAADLPAGSTTRCPHRPATDAAAGTVILPSAENPATVVSSLDDASLMTGEDLVDAQASFDQRTNQPVVNFRLSTSGARRSSAT